MAFYSVPQAGQPSWWVKNILQGDTRTKSLHIFLSCIATTLGNTKRHVPLPGKGFCLFFFFSFSNRNPVSSACMTHTPIRVGMRSHALYILIHICFFNAKPKWQMITYLPRSSHRTMLSGPTGAYLGRSSPADLHHLDSSVVWCRI